MGCTHRYCRSPIQTQQTGVQTGIQEKYNYKWKIWGFQEGERRTTRQLAKCYLRTGSGGELKGLALVESRGYGSSGKTRKTTVMIAQIAENRKAVKMQQNTR